MFRKIAEKRKRKQEAQELERVKNSCEGCIHLEFNNSGQAECMMGYEHKCSPRTRVLKRMRPT